MTNLLLRRVSIFIVPAALLGAAYCGFARIATLPPAWGLLAPYLPAACIAAGMFLSIHFHRGRPFFVLLMLATFAWCNHTYLAGGPVDFRSRILFESLSLLLPLNITLFCFMRERGVFSVAGRLRLGFLLGQAILIVWLIERNVTGVTEFLSRHFVTSPFLERLAISQPAAAVVAIGALLITIRVVRRQSPVESGFLASLLAVSACCNWLTTPNLPLAFLAAAAMALTVGVLRDSYNMAFRDDLTGLPSRRALNELLEGLGRQYAIAMVDVDHFKRFNDTYGHDVGDQVLKMVAVKLQGVGGGGKSYRYGGEEFTVVFSRKTVADAVPPLEELRKSIAGYHLRLRGADRPKKADEGKRKRGERETGETVSVTVSIGVAESDEQRKPAEVIKEADKALYRAKKMGRNRLCK